MQDIDIVDDNSLTTIKPIIDKNVTKIVGGIYLSKIKNLILRNFWTK